VSTSSPAVQPPAPRRLHFGEFEVDTAAARLMRDGVPVHLEPRTLHLLVFLLDHQRRLVTKAELIEQVWSSAFVTDNALDRAVARLRKALGDDVRAPRFIETVPTQGYRFVAEVSSETIAERAADATAAGAPGDVVGGLRVRSVVLSRRLLVGLHLEPVGGARDLGEVARPRRSRPPAHRGRRREGGGVVARWSLDRL
jgi:DNA-binding winged helix-turn-helix (wHTH) protein